MPFSQFKGNPSQIIIEQLVASGVTKLFYNSGSREAPFFDALHERSDIDGILALHEGSVTAMAGGYTQVNAQPAVMVVHLGAGLAQCLGQLINISAANLPVVIITFAGDTGSFADLVSLDISHDFGPTSISAPFTKANWTVVEPEGLPAAIDRALRVSKTPPIGPVHIAVYDRMLNNTETTVDIVHGGISDLRSGYPSDDDIDQVLRILAESERPLIYVGDGVWKSGAENGIASIAEYFGVPVSSTFSDLRGISAAHPLYCGRFEEAAKSLNPDQIICIGARHGGMGKYQDYAAFATADRVLSLGSDPDSVKNIPGLGYAILADESRSLDRIQQLVSSEGDQKRYSARYEWAVTVSSTLRAERRRLTQLNSGHPNTVNPISMLDALDVELEQRGGGLITTEQFAAPLDCVQEKIGGGSNIYIRPASGSEGYGVGAPIGVKLAAPDKPVVGLVGDGSMYYADSGLWTAAHHKIPVLYLIANNGAYGVVAGAFGSSGGTMFQTGEYAGVRLDGIDPVKIATGFGVEAVRVDKEDMIRSAIEQGLNIVQNESRPYLLDVRLPIGLPEGGKEAVPFRMA